MALALVVAVLPPAPAAAAPEQIGVLALTKGQAVLLIDGRRRNLAVGETSPEGVTLTSATSESATVAIAGKERKLKLASGIASRYQRPAPSTPVRILPTRQGMYLTSGSINGFSVRFLVDTGATLVAMNRGQAERLGIPYLIHGRPGRASTANGVVRTYQVTLRSVRIGSIELRNVKASVVDGDFPREVLLGNSFLNRLEMRRNGKVLELRNRRL